MPHYNFHIRDDTGRVPVHEGLYCIDLAAARVEAVACARDLLAQGAQNCWPVLNGCVEIVNTRGVVLARVSLRSLLD